jgi:hypothetical protein
VGDEVLWSNARAWTPFFGSLPSVWCGPVPELCGDLVGEQFPGFPFFRSRLMDEPPHVGGVQTTGLRSSFGLGVVSAEHIVLADHVENDCTPDLHALTDGIRAERANDRFHLGLLGEVRQWRHRLPSSSMGRTICAHIPTRSAMSRSAT